MSSVREEIRSALAIAPMFTALSPQDLDQLAALAVRKLYSPQELLFAEGETCDGLYIVERGRVRIFKTSASGREQVLSIEGPGATVAELPVFDGGPYPASVVALEESQMIFLSRRDFRAYCLERPQVALLLLAQVGARLRRLVGIIEELSFTTIRQRLIAMLLRQAEATGHQTARGIAMELPASHQEIANQLGTVRELVSRNLTRLEAEGYLEVDARHILIRDKKAFAALLE